MRQGAAALSWCSVTFRCTASYACREIGWGKERLHYPGAALHFVTFRCTASHACREIGRGKERLHYPGSALHFVARRHMPAVKSDAARSGCTILVLRYISLHGVTYLP